MKQLSGEFAGTDRFRIVRRLGAGSTGAVYVAHDTKRDELVALKTLQWADPAAIYRLKREFRALADISHPNIVSLYELIGEGNSWFFTMELLDGAPFVDYVRAGGLQINRLRDVLLQLAEAVHAIHLMDRMHRDLKPPNVLVTRTGRVVVLDFGIATDIVSGDPRVHTIEHGIAGTIAYMAPEQTSPDVTAAADWYAVGVMLYEALTGELPFHGTMVKLLSEKLTKDPLPPDELVSGLPLDLVALCRELLQRDPAKRLSGEQVLARLGHARAADRDASTAADQIIIGRDAALAELDAAYRSAGEGQAVSVYVHGPSGIGKTSLVARFLDEVRARDDVVVLQGRCYVRESVPYKGLDGVIDSLSRVLRMLPEAVTQHIITPDLRTVARLFPALERVESIARLEDPLSFVQEPLQLRRRGFAALRELFVRLCERHRIVIHIDDVQWSDTESLLLLEDLLGPPAPPPLLLVLCLRDEDIEAHSALRVLLQRTRTSNHREIHVRPLTDIEMRRLVQRLWHADTAAPVDAIVHEAAGNPYLLEELVRHASTAQQPQRGAAVSLEQMLEQRIARFPAEARALLEILAVAGRPLDVSILRDAAELHDERPLLKLLEAEHCVRLSGSTNQLGLYHDRLRESLAARIPAERTREIHRRLADIIERRGHDDPETMYEHYAELGASHQAGQYAERAGLRADKALAFDRAAYYYQRALELTTWGDASSWLRSRLANALANAGRGAEAASAYLDAAEQATGPHALDMRRRAAEQLLRCGHVDHGLSVVRAVSRDVGLRLARSPTHALIRLLLRRALLRVRGCNFTPRRPEQIDPLTLSRLDVTWTVATGLARVDNIRAADFQSLQLLLALRAGEPFRVCRALAAEAGFLSSSGLPALQRATRLVELGRKLAENIDDPRAAAFTRFAAGITAFWTGRFRAAREDCEAAERLLRERCTGVVWELNTAQTFTSSALVYLGEFQEVARRQPIRLREAREHGDLYATADVTTGRANVVWLVRDDAAGAGEALRAAMGAWSLQGFHLQHYFSLFAQSQIDLYTGNTAAAWSRLAEHWRALERSMLLRVQLIRLESLHLRARCALAEAAVGHERETHLQAAERYAQRMLRERTHWANPLAWLIHAGVHTVRGNDDAALTLLERAVEGFAAADMTAYAAAARHQQGQLRGGSAGAALTAAAAQWFAAQHVLAPSRLIAMLAPGFT